MAKYLSLSQIDAYTISFHLSNYVWNVVLDWDYFSKKTIGEQLVRSMDSISANIAEGFGRYHKKDKIKFYRYSYGSMEETKDWIRKCIKRQLITQEQQQFIIQELEKLPKTINQLIQYTNEKLKY